MYNISKILGSSFTDDSVRAGLQAWQDDVYAELEAAGKMADPKVRFGGTIPLQLLDHDLQVELMGRYRKLIGLDQVLHHLSGQGPSNASKYLRESWGLEDTINAQVMNVWENLVSEKSLFDDSPYGRFQGDLKDNSLIGRIYRSMNLQLYNRPSRATKTGTESPGRAVRQYFGMGSIPQLDALDRPVNVDLRNKNILALDIETAGLRPGSIREVAFRSYQTGAEGVVDFGQLTRTMGEEKPLIFRPIQGGRGTMVHQGRAVPVDEFLKAEFGLDAPVSSKGDDFIAKIMPFLKKASEADMIVGHNIESFDFANIFQSIAATGRYERDPEFAKQVDDIYKQIQAKTVDTLRMARQAPNLQGLKGFAEGINPYSLENILLNTDLSKRIGINNIADAMGMARDAAGNPLEDAKGNIIFQKGLHFGDVDTLLDAGFLQVMPDLKQVSMVKSASSARDIRVAKAIQAHAMQSAAITPFTDIRNPAHIHQTVLDKIGPNAKVNPIEHEIIFERNLELHNSQNVLQTAINGPPSQDLLRSFGDFDRMIKRHPSMSYADVYDRLVKPNATAYAAYQERLAKLGFGFSGISYEERLYGTALSDITLKNLPGFRGSVARQTLVSQFQGFDPKAIEYMTRSGKITLPAQVLKAAGLLEKDNPASYLISVVRPTTKKATPSINLAYKFTSAEDIDEVEKTLRAMYESEERFSKVMGFAQRTDSRAAYNHFVEHFEKNSFTELLRNKTTEDYGVSVAQITDRDQVTAIMALESAVNNTDDLDDVKRLKFGLVHGDITVDTAGKGQVTTAGVVYQRGLDKADKQSIARSVEATKAIYDPESGLRGIVPSANWTQAARYYDTAQVVSPRMDKMFNTINTKILPNFPKVALGTLAIGLAGYFYKRKRDNDRYDMDFAYEGRQPGPSRYAVAEVLQARIDAGYNGGRQQIDPLATANLTHHLYYTANGQHSLDWDKNTAIYGGVL